MEKNEIAISDLFRSLLRHLPIILAVTILFGAASFLFSRFFIKPTYVASAKMIAISNTDRTNDYYTSAEHNAAVALVNTTSEVIKTDSILTEASSRLKAEGVEYTEAQLKKMISVSSENETEVFRLSITSTNQASVALVANTIAGVAEERIGEITQAGAVKLLDPAKTPTSQASPNLMRNVVLGALIGFVLMALIMILRDLYDTTIWTEEDLTNHYKYPVLGLVPQLDEDEGGAKAKAKEA